MAFCDHLSPHLAQIHIQACRFSRECVRLSIEHCRWRKAFGKPLADQPVVRHRIAEMVRQVETTHALLESLCYRFSAVERKGEEDWFSALLRGGASAAIAKVRPCAGKLICCLRFRLRFCFCFGVSATLFAKFNNSIMFDGQAILQPRATLTNIN